MTDRPRFLQVLEEVLRLLIGVGCLYEVAALPKRSPLPTLSSLCWGASDSPRGRLLVWALLGLFAWHILGIGPLARPEH